FLASEGIEIPDATISTSYVAFNNRLVGQIISKKSYDESSLKFIKSLVKNFSGYRIGVLSGDPSFAGQERFESTFENVSYFGNLSPEDKAYKIKPNSIFVGDGLNDTLAFAKADVSIRLGHRILGYGPVDIEIKVPNLNLILRVLDYAGSYRTVLKQNAAAALLYNAIALSLAAMGKFSPLGAVVAMIISFLALLFNSLRLLSVPEV
ncbi:MAG: cation-translocating P-type ATPase, partial [Bdellovibrionales bacterium]|nr:cation-translocating P-type ATPase [Bdellovibrionales bacterium]